MTDKEQLSLIPARHQEIINLLLSGERLESMARVPEDTYVQIDNEAYAGNFITCPAIVIYQPDGSKKCLHVRFPKLIQALEKKTFDKNIDFKTLAADIASSQNITILLSESSSTGESREKELQLLSDLLRKLAGSEKKIRSLAIPGTQFQLVITPQAISIWNGVNNIGLV